MSPRPARRWVGLLTRKSTAEMARPRKKTLEFFMHDTGARHDLKIKSLERRHGNDGYAVYFKLLEMCGQQEGMCLSLRSPLVVEQVVEETRMRDEAHLYAIIQTCCELELLCASHWSVKREVFSNGLYKRYIGRLEERREAAERKRRQREAESLQMRISELEADEIQSPDPNSEFRSQIADPDPDPERPEQSHEVTTLSRVTTEQDGGEERGKASPLRSPDPNPEPAPQNPPLPVQSAAPDRLTGASGENVPPPAAPAHDLFARRGVPQVVPIQAQFQGPWGVGYTPELGRFEAWLLEHKAKGKDNPSSWVAAVVNGIAKGGSRALWDEFQRFEAGETAPAAPVKELPAWKKSFMGIA